MGFNVLRKYGKARYAEKTAKATPRREPLKGCEGRSVEGFLKADVGDIIATVGELEKHL